MAKPLRVLIVEDSEDDAILMLRELQRGGYDVDYKIADSEDALNAALDGREWDVVLSDHSLPGFSGPAALSIVKGRELDIPFIIVSGTIGEDTAVEAMKAGAHDFFTKNNITRLVPAVERELREAEERRQRREAEAQLDTMSRLMERAFASLKEVVFVVRDRKIVTANPAVEAIFGYRVDEVRGHDTLMLHVDRDSYEQFGRLSHPALEREGVFHTEWEMRRKDGSVFVSEHTVSLLNAEGDLYEGVVSVVRDITERKRAKIAELEQRKLAEALRDTTAALLGSTLDLDEVLDRILMHIAELLSFDAADMMLVESGVASVSRSRGLPETDVDAIMALQFPVDEMANLRAMRDSGRSFIVADTRGDQEWHGHQSPALGWVRSSMGAPMHVGDQCVGFIHLDSSEAGAFNETHAERLQAFADQAAIAIQNARLHEAVRRYAAELEQRVIERTAELNEAKESVEAILNNSSDAIIVTRPDGTIQRVNPAFNVLFGADSEAISDRPLTAFAHEDSAETLGQTLRDVVENKSSNRIEIMARRTDGTLFDADVVISPVLQDYDRVLGIVCSVRDISEHKRMEVELREALAAERDLSELRSRFVSTVSHEFRTPLATILSSNELLKAYSDRMTGDRKQSHHEKIEAQVQHLTALMENILIIGRAETVGLEFEPASISLEALCRSLVEQIELTDASKHDLVLHCSPECGFIVADEKMLRLVLTNLLSNATKYSPVGSQVTLEVVCESDEMVIQVSDEGIGIAEKDQARLFDAFYRAGNVGTVSGTGLGLSIVKQMVDAYGGSVAVESVIDEGTTFTVTLPIPQDEN